MIEAVGSLALRVPPDAAAATDTSQRLRYALPFPFQCAPNTMGLMVMRMVEGTGNYGFLDGSDIVLLDSLEPAGCRRVFPATRNEELADAAGGGVNLSLKSPLIGGFVPLGALAADGTTHPHAGTGFGVCQAHTFPGFERGSFTWRDPDREDFNETYALSFDGAAFKTERMGVFTQQPGRPLKLAESGWALLVTGITSAIPDGNDLLLPVSAVRIDRSATAVGVARWARGAGAAWSVVDFEAVESSEGDQTAGGGAGTRRSIEACPWMEPSLVREGGGRLLFSARGADTYAAVPCPANLQSLSLRLSVALCGSVSLSLSIFVCLCGTHIFRCSVAARRLECVWFLCASLARGACERGPTGRDRGRGTERGRAGASIPVGRGAVAAQCEAQLPRHDRLQVLLSLSLSRSLSLSLSLPLSLFLSPSPCSHSPLTINLQWQGRVCGIEPVHS